MCLRTIGRDSEPLENPDELLPVKKTGFFDKWFVTRFENSPAKGWFIIAVAVGLVATGIGGLGAVGLLHSYGIISLPQWLASAIGTVGQTPHFWSLWTIAVGGVLGGGAMIMLSSYKIHQLRKQERVFGESNLNDLYYIMEQFSNNFDEIGVDPKQFYYLDIGEYTPCYYSQSVESKSFFFVLRYVSGDLVCTKKMDFGDNAHLEHKLSSIYTKRPLPADMPSNN